ncbi:thiamine phosphate synthase [Alphaproteobacteria bacterium KMM 3653]|uniref:Thiamine phosphate synthase n=1 Tax=Harenicola maris TaxID=2841044 RepID=A0AAP2G7R5_9RHOB|nr:thiamine phosphate synthase [Harenicola maris]
MTEQFEAPQTYLITPPAFELSRFEGDLGAVLDAHEIACVRLVQASEDAGAVAKIADRLREICHERDVALVIDSHLQMVEQLGLDGVHLPTGGAAAVRSARKALGDEAIVGAFCGASRHDGMSAGEAGADYIAFGPVSPTPLGDGTLAEDDLFGWWSQMIELPVVAEGGLSAGRVTALAPLTDFFGVGPEIWDRDNPAKALGELMAGAGPA